MEYEKYNKIMRRDSMEIVGVEDIVEAGSILHCFDVNCAKCGNSTIVKLKDSNDIVKYKCSKCERLRVSRGYFLSNTGMVKGKERIKLGSDSTARYFQYRLKKIWDYQVKLGISEEFKEYAKFEEWALNSGYKPWKDLIKLDDAPLSSLNGCWGAKFKNEDKQFDKIIDNDTYKNRVKYLGEILGRADKISAMYLEIKDLLNELECSRYCMNSDIEMILDQVLRNYKENEWLKDMIDSIYIGEQSTRGYETVMKGCNKTYKKE